MYKFNAIILLDINVLIICTSLAIINILKIFQVILPLNKWTWELLLLVYFVVDVCFVVVISKHYVVAIFYDLFTWGKLIYRNGLLWVFMNVILKGVHYILASLDDHNQAWMIVTMIICFVDSSSQWYGVYSVYVTAIPKTKISPDIHCTILYHVWLPRLSYFTNQISESGGYTFMTKQVQILHLEYSWSVKL